MIRGDHVMLGPLDQAYADRTRHWMNDPELAGLLGRARPVTDLEHSRWLAAVGGSADCVFFAILTTAGNAHVGNVWLWNIEARHGKAEVRIVLGGSEHTGKGLGSEALRLIAAYAFEFLNLRKLTAFVLDANPRARRAFEKAGFATEAVLRADRWVGDHYGDVYLLARFREEPSPKSA